MLWRLLGCPESAKEIDYDHHQDADEEVLNKLSQEASEAIARRDVKAIQRLYNDKIVQAPGLGKKVRRKLQHAQEKKWYRDAAAAAASSTTSSSSVFSSTALAPIVYVAEVLSPSTVAASSSSLDSCSSIMPSNKSYSPLAKKHHDHQDHQEEEGATTATPSSSSSSLTKPVSKKANAENINSSNQTKKVLEPLPLPARQTQDPDAFFYDLWEGALNPHGCE